MIGLAALGAFIGLFSLWVVLPKVFLNKKIKGERSIIYYGENEHKPSRYDSPVSHSSRGLDRVGHYFKR